MDSDDKSMTIVLVAVVVMLSVCVVAICCSKAYTDAKAMEMGYEQVSDERGRVVWRPSLDR